MKIITLFLILGAAISCSGPKIKTFKDQIARVIEQDSLEFLVQDSILIQTRDSSTLQAIIVRPNDANPRATILFHTIYARPERDLRRAIRAAKRGYNGMVTYSRGKGLSESDIIPYETEAKDVYDIHEWISQQVWSNREIGMYGGSYVGFTQWAGTKQMHPSLKTIVPFVSAAPGIGEPMENGVVANYFYPWPFYVGNNRTLDNDIYFDQNRWINLNFNWYESGAAHNKMDSIDGLPNPIFNKWLDHPSYDEYWQSMIPYREEFAKIDIPVLSITGYFDGGQIGALYYLMEHYRYNPNAEHYLLIGPYTHFGAQVFPDSTVMGYEVDQTALMSMTDLTFNWFDYIFKSAAKPEILQGKINYQLMGSNEWRHVESIAKLSEQKVRYYLSNQSSDVDAPFDAGNNGKTHFTLDRTEPEESGHLLQEMDFLERSGELQNNSFTPWVISDTLTVGHGFSFIGPPMEEDMEFSGFYSGQLIFIVNKKDFDYSFVLYELTPDNQFFQLALRNIGRASQTGDRTQRRLLTPGRKESISFESARMTAKKVSQGSRLVLVLNLNKNPFEQINYGSGKNVREETIKDGQESLIMKWSNKSFVEVPLKPYY